MFDRKNMTDEEVLAKIEEEKRYAPTKRYRM